MMRFHVVVAAALSLVMFSEHMSALHTRTKKQAKEAKTQKN